MGIGRATAHLFAESGAKAVYICDYDSKNLEAHKREIASLYPTVDVHTRQFDAADEEAVKAVVDHAMQTYGRLDVFFANAGVVGPMAAFTDISKDDFMKVLDTNTARLVSSRHRPLRYLTLPSLLPTYLPTYPFIHLPRGRTPLI